MKSLKYLLLFFIANSLILSCSSDDDNVSNPIQNETENLNLVQVITNDQHSIALYTKTGKLTEGFNRIYMQIKDQNNDLVSNVNLNWKPTMVMESMHHGAPHSNISKSQGTQTLYEGFIIFQMASHADEYWELEFEYSINGISYEMSSEINVLAAAHRRVMSFAGNDGENYIVALIEPSEPQAAINDMTAAIYTMNAMHDYSIVNQYKLKIDPRMPSMGNHGSPNNQDLTQGSDQFYHGKLSLTMTGYWKINLILENAEGENLKGEPITEENENSSIFFEIEF